MTYRNVSKFVIKRLPVYLRKLDNLISYDVEVVSSQKLSEETGFTAEQIRKDLACFGAFGTRGSGYNVEYLRDKILKIIGLHKQTRVIVVGVGNLGKAFSRYNFINNPYVKIVGLFDSDTEVVGEKIFYLKIEHISEMKKVLVEENVKVAILAVPAKEAQKMADQLVADGITAIFNFAPIKLKLPPEVYIHNVDLTLELQSLIYFSSTKDNLVDLEDAFGNF